MTRNDHPRTVDFHAHFLEREALELCLAHSVATDFGRQKLPPHLDGPIEKMSTHQSLIDDMDRRGIDISVISSASVLVPTYWADTPAATTLARKINDKAAAVAAQVSDRIIGSFVLPLQSIEASLAEFRRAVESLCLKVANVPAEVRGIYLGDPVYRPFWEAAQDAGVAVIMHPDGAKDRWFFQYGMWNSLAQSLEETKFMASIIYEGILESFPRLKIVVVHGGGYFPHNMGRLDRNVKNAPQSMKNITRRPSGYLKSVYYDTCLYDPTVLSSLLKIVGPERMLLGSDYPVGEADPVAFVTSCPDLDEGQRGMILGERACALLGG